jgi:hypothetical protein
VKTKKKIYQKPVFAKVIIDKDISLVMQSTPGGGDPPDWGDKHSHPKHKNPYKSPFQ